MNMRDGMLKLVIKKDLISMD